MDKRKILSLFLIISIVFFAVHAPRVEAFSFDSVFHSIFDPIATAFKAVVSTITLAVVLVAPLFIAPILGTINLVSSGVVPTYRDLTHDIQCWGYNGNDILNGLSCRDRGGVLAFSNGQESSCPSEIVFNDLRFLPPIIGAGDNKTYEYIAVSSYENNYWNDYLSNNIVRSKSEYDNPNSTVLIYRFTLPYTEDQAAVTNWYYNISKKVGQGIISFQPEFIKYPYHWQTVPAWGLFGLTSIQKRVSDVDNYVDGSGGYKPAEEQPYAAIPFKEFCNSGICKFVDRSIPSNSYVAYVAKVLGHYSVTVPTGGWGIFGPTVFSLVDGNDKFLTTKSPNNIVNFPARDSSGQPIVDDNINSIYAFKTDKCESPLPFPPPPGMPDVTPIGAVNIDSIGSVGGNSGGGNGGSGGFSCRSISLGIKAPGATDYIVYRDGVEINRGKISSVSTTVSDPNVIPRKVYEYRVIVSNAGGESEVTERLQTICLPQCSLMADKEVIPKFGTVKLGWECGITGLVENLADRCSLDDITNSTNLVPENIGRGDRDSKSIPSLSRSTEYKLSCTNMDGKFTTTKKIIVETANYKEINPR